MGDEGFAFVFFIRTKPQASSPGRTVNIAPTGSIPGLTPRNSHLAPSLVGRAGEGSQQTPRHRQPRHHNRDHTHQLYQNIQRRARRIFEWISNGIANNGSFVNFAAFSA